LWGHEKETKVLSLEQVVRNITEAFIDADMPGADELFGEESDVRHPDYGEVISCLKGRKWSDLDIDDLHDIELGFFAFTPKAFAYYLPALLIFIVKDYPSEDDLAGTLMFVLAPGLIGLPHLNRRVEQMTQKQKMAVKSFFEYLQHQHPEYFDEDLGLTEVEAYKFWIAVK